MNKSGDFGMVARIEKRKGIPLSATSLRSYDAEAVSDETGVDTGDVSLVQQHYQDEVDINQIVKRFGLTQEFPLGVAGGMYGDFTDIQDYDDAVRKIERAEAAFMSLPPQLRERFNNDPGELIAKVQNMTPEEFEALAHVPVNPGVVVPPVVAPVVAPVEVNKES